MHYFSLTAALSSLLWSFTAPLPAQDSGAWNEIGIGQPLEGFLPIELTTSDDPNLIFELEVSEDLESWSEDPAGWVVLDRLDSNFQRIGFLAKAQDRSHGFMRVNVSWNTPPIAKNDRIFLPDRGPTPLAIFDNDHDPDGDQVTLVEYREATHGTVTMSNGILFYEAPTNFSGIDYFDYSIRDSHGTLSTARVVLVIPNSDDTDADELPNDWETQHGLDPNDSSDQMVDQDRDGYPNLYEYHHGSDPTDRHSTPLPSVQVSTALQLQQRLILARSFDIIALAPGIYVGGDWHLPGEDRPVMIIASAGQGTSIIDVGAAEAKRAFNFEALQDARSALSGLVIENGRSSLGTSLRFVDQSAATIIDCVLRGGDSEKSGGAVYVRDASPRFERCVFENNAAGGFGGAVYATGSLTSLSFEECIFRSNTTASDGGAVYLTGEAAAEFTTCHLDRNQAAGNGGALAFGSNTVASVNRCYLVNNTSGSDGGAISCRVSAHPSISNSIISQNSAVGRGGALYSGNEAQASLNHCTLTNNQADAGGGVYHFQTSVVTIRNSILWGNAPQQLLTNNGEDIAHSIVEEINPSHAEEDPMWVAGEITFRLHPNSPARDAGHLQSIDLVDIDGEPRGPAPDIGADEFVDHDADAMPDHWELTVGLDPSKNDANSDLDGDGETNLDAYLNGHDPGAQLPPSITISGQILSLEESPMPSRVVITEAPKGTQPLAETTATLSGAFSIEGIPRNTALWIHAYQDQNGNHVKDLCEPTSQPQSLRATESIIDLMITVPPVDQDAPVLIGVPKDLSVPTIQEIPPVPEVFARDGDQWIDVHLEEDRFDPSSGTTNQVRRTWSAHDPCGNTVSATQIITVDASTSGEIGRFLTSFELGQGYVPGPIQGQDGWEGSDEGVRVTEKLRTQGDTNTLALTQPNSEANRPFNASAASVIDLTFSLYLESTAGRPPAPEDMPHSASAMVSYDATRGIVALDGNGKGGGQWVAIPGTRLPNQWIDVRIVKDDATATWTLSLNGQQVQTGLGYKDHDRLGLSRLRITNGDYGSAYMDNFILTHQ